jgi:hypothetical protein
LGFILSTIASIITIQWQHKLSLKEQKTQLYLDEKKDFINACEVYLTEFRNWYKLMNFYTLGSRNNSYISEYDSLTAGSEYIKWKKKFDIAYGRIFLLSDNDFRQLTMEVSTVLPTSLSKSILDKSLSDSTKQIEFAKAQVYFFSKWLTRANQEIMRFNAGERLELTMIENINSIRLRQEEKYINDSLDLQMYKNFLPVFEYGKKRGFYPDSANLTLEDFKRLFIQ